MDTTLETSAGAVPRVPLLLRRLARRPAALVGLAMLVLAVAFAVAGNLGNPYGHLDQDLVALGVPPGEGGHRLGTDEGGFDLWALLVRGTGRSLLIAFAVGLVSPLLAALYGATIGHRGGRVERIGVAVLDLLALLPAFLLVAVVMGSSGGGALVLALVLAAASWIPTARVVRAATRSIREREYVRAARYMGVPEHRIVLRHIVPQLGSYLVLATATGTIGAILTETALSYLGVGVRPPDVSLGRLIGQSSDRLDAYPWLFWGPVACLLWLTIGLSLLADGVRDALDPHGRAGGRA